MPALSPDAFAARLTPLLPLMRSYAKTALLQFTRAHVPASDTEDAVSDMTLRALHSLPSYDDAHGDTGLKKWLYVILRRCCWAIAQGERTTALEESAASSPSPEAHVLARLDAQARMQAAKLSRMESNCLLWHWQGFAAADIAAKLGKPIEQIYCHICRARQKVRKAEKARQP